MHANEKIQHWTQGIWCYFNGPYTQTAGWFRLSSLSDSGGSFCKLTTLIRPWDEYCKLWYFHKRLFQSCCHTLQRWQNIHARALNPHWKEFTWWLETTINFYVWGRIEWSGGCSWFKPDPSEEMCAIIFAYTSDIGWCWFLFISTVAGYYLNARKSQLWDEISNTRKVFCMLV